MAFTQANVQFPLPTPFSLRGKGTVHVYDIVIDAADATAAIPHGLGGNTGGGPNDVEVELLPNGASAAGFFTQAVNVDTVTVPAGFVSGVVNIRKTAGALASFRMIVSRRAYTGRSGGR